MKTITRWRRRIYTKKIETSMNSNCLAKDYYYEKDILHKFNQTQS